MARNSRVKPTNPRPQKSQESGKGFSNITVAVIALVASIFSSIGGAFVQRHFDVLDTNQSLVIEYSKAANDSSKSVESIVSNLVSELGNPEAQITHNQTEQLKEALLKLRRDTELLNIQVGSASTPFRTYEESMANLSEVAQSITGSADAKYFIEALSAFYVAKKHFEEQVASKYRSTSV